MTKKLKLAQFLGAISISSATESTFKLLIREGYDSIEKINAMSEGQIARCGASEKRTVGDKRAAKIYESFHSNRVQACLVHAEKWVAEPSESGGANLLMDINGKNVVFTGKGPFGRKELKSALEDAGAIVQSGVSSTTHLLIVGDIDTNSGKAKKARSLGVEMVTYDKVFPS